MQYVIVKTITVTPTYEGERPYMVNMVYGPFDEQGCSAAYRLLRSTWPEADFTVRGLMGIDPALLDT